MDKARRLENQAHFRKFSFTRPLPILFHPNQIDSLVLTCWLVFTILEMDLGKKRALEVKRVATL